jgi:hypothetical protein
MKRLIAVLIACLCFLSGCGGSGKGGGLSVTPVEAAEQIYSQVEFKDNLLAAENDVLENYYPGIGALADNAVAFISGSGGTAEEIAVLQAKNIDDVEKLRELAENRVEELKFRFENYVPAEMVKLDSATVVVKGDAVFLVICDDAQSAADAIDALTK